MFVFPRIELSNSQTLNLNGLKAGIFLLDFALQLGRKNSDVLGIHFILVDAAGISLTLIQNQIAKTKERGRWIHFKV